MPSRSRGYANVLIHDAVYWGNPASDGTSGRIFDDPVAVKVRWDWVGELFRTANGRELTSKAIVQVGQPMDPGGYLWLGPLDEVDSSGLDPLSLEDSLEIMSYESIDNLKGTRTARRVWL